MEQELERELEQELEQEQELELELLNFSIYFPPIFMDSPTPVDPQPLTFGQKAVGLTFNPSGDMDVVAVKEAFSHAIDLCNDLRIKAGHGEKGRLLSVAITEAQGAQMWAVKAITWKD